MPLVKVIRKGVTPSVRKVPTSTAAVMLPMTLNKIGKEAASENEELSRVEDINDAFAKFKPELNFKGSAGAEETEFKAEFKFKSMKDFDPENLQKRQEFRDEDGNVTYARNDIADLKANIDLLYRLKDRWKLPTVRRAWNSETQRAEIIQALGRLKEDLTKLSGKGGQ
ncbi:MAG: type VI secretion system contractile sheath small subunit [Bryobacteraceae bacterium]|nr:type VI secretion system contractile sheath small subunit [Bryobacteraceae bacterium]